MKKSLHIAQIIDSLGSGGAEKLLLTFTEAAIAAGHKVSIISLIDNRTVPAVNFNVTQLSSLGANLIFINSLKLYEIRPFLKLIKLFRHEKFDVVQSHLSHGDILGGIVGWLTSTPVVATLHTPNPRQIGHYHIREFLWKFVLRYFSKKTIVVSRGIEEAYRSTVPASKLELVLNAVNIPAPLTDHERNKIRAEMTSNPQAKLIICVGRLVPSKGISELLQAFVSIREENADAMLVIVGGGEIQNDLISQARSLGVFEHVHFLGYRNDIQDLLKGADMYVSASYLEGMSIALLEAMAAGLPIVATNVGEVPYLLENQRGVLIPPRDVEAIAKGIIDLLNNPNEMRRMGAAAREYAENHLAPSVWLNQLMNIYNKVIGSKDI